MTPPGLPKWLEVIQELESRPQGSKLSALFIKSRCPTFKASAHLHTAQGLVASRRGDYVKVIMVIIIIDK